MQKHFNAIINFTFLFVSICWIGAFMEYILTFWN